MGTQSAATKRGKVIRFRKDPPRIITQRMLADYCLERQTLRDMEDTLKPQRDRVERGRKKLKRLMRLDWPVQEGLWRIELKPQRREACEFEVVRVSS